MSVLSISSRRESYSLEQGVAQGAADERAARADGLAGAHRGQAGVDLDQVHGDQVAGGVDALGDEVALAQGQAAADGRAGAGRPLGVEGVDVEGQMDRGVVADVGEGHLDDAADAVAAGQLVYKDC